MIIKVACLTICVGYFQMTQGKFELAEEICAKICEVINEASLAMGVSVTGVTWCRGKHSLHSDNIAQCLFPFFCKTETRIERFWTTVQVQCYITVGCNNVTLTCTAENSKLQSGKSCTNVYSCFIPSRFCLSSFQTGLLWASLSFRRLASFVSLTTVIQAPVRRSYLSYFALFFEQEQPLSLLLLVFQLVHFHWNVKCPNYSRFKFVCNMAASVKRVPPYVDIKGSF